MSCTENRVPQTEPRTVFAALFKFLYRMSPCNYVRDDDPSKASALRDGGGTSPSRTSLVPRPSYTAADGLHHRYVKRVLISVPSSRNVGTPIRFEACNNCIPQLLFKVIRNR